ncbi:hypothetical protein GCK32_008913 [Trichostrongylus colubriformis]|uniref:Uncharacterized protein n=1 Tax=Trichostrongylus colubriformis TaxID=6319 RepID=A0AAN8IU78_TRICO
MWLYYALSLALIITFHTGIASSYSAHPIPANVEDEEENVPGYVGRVLEWFDRNDRALQGRLPEGNGYENENDGQMYERKIYENYGQKNERNRDENAGQKDGRNRYELVYGRSTRTRHENALNAAQNYRRNLYDAGQQYGKNITENATQDYMRNRNENATQTHGGNPYNNTVRGSALYTYMQQQLH